MQQVVVLPGAEGKLIQWGVHKLLSVVSDTSDMSHLIEAESSALCIAIIRTAELFG